MNTLPIEIQDRIWNDYWMFKYNDVISEIEKPLKLEKKALDFYGKFIGVLNYNYKSSYKYYFSSLNIELKDVVTNKGTMIIAKNCQLLIRYITNDYLKCIFKDVPKDYKHVAALCVLISGQQRYNTLNLFNNINRYIS